MKCVGFIVSAQGGAKFGNLKKKIIVQYGCPCTRVLSISRLIKVPKIKFLGFLVSGPGGPKVEKNHENRKFPKIVKVSKYDCSCIQTYILRLDRSILKKSDI